MSDARWLDIATGLDLAEKHLDQAEKIRALPAFDPETFNGYVHGMALMHAMQSGYTTIEGVLVNVLDILGEDRPVGKHWHTQLLDRMAKPMTEAGLERDAILDIDLANDLKELSRFRHRAVHCYDEFKVERSGPATVAAANIRKHLRPALEAFRRRIDPTHGPGVDKNEIEDGPP